jgi:hypothetical protein
MWHLIQFGINLIECIQHPRPLLQLQLQLLHRTPVYEPVVEPVAGPDPVTEPVVEPVVPPGAYPPYIPGVTPFPGIPGLGDLDFSGLPGMGDIDIDRIIQEYQDRIDAGEPEPFDSFLPRRHLHTDMMIAQLQKIIFL